VTLAWPLSPCLIPTCPHFVIPCFLPGHIFPGGSLHLSLKAWLSWARARQQLEPWGLPGTVTIGQDF
jgi:hypothetical protein